MTDDALIQWSPETLRKVLAENLAGAELIVVSNREPYISERARDRIEWRVPASGLVSALDPIMRTFSGTWIAHGDGSADRETVDSDDRLAVPPDDPKYTLRRIWLSEEEHRGHYSGFSNESLWPLCHIAFTRPVFRAEDWETYARVNRRFAEAVVQEARTSNPVVLVQDYHFALLPAMVRQLLPDASILTFWHIPWPNAEVFGVCPWRKAILEGMLGSSILGFHTPLHGANFLESIDRFLEARTDWPTGLVHREGWTTAVRDYPISIPWPDQGKSAGRAAREAVEARYGLSADTRLIIGVDRLDYTKGIIERLQAFDILLQTHPEWIGQVVLMQVSAPSRSTLPAYQRLRRECTDLVDNLNARYGSGQYRPIIWLERHHERSTVNELMRAADICLVTSLHDGMNLVAKEFVAQRGDNDGVLILSAFAGAAQELGDALLVNPFDTTTIADTIHRALTMPKRQQKERMRAMREIVRVNNVYRWAGHMLIDAAEVRRRNAVDTGPDSQSSTSAEVFL